MGNDELTGSAGQEERVRITVTTIEVSAGAADRLPHLDETRRTPTPREGRHAVLALPLEPPRRERASVGQWSPLRPFKPLRANYLMARQALGAGGRMGVVHICIVAGLAAVVWRHYTLPIGITGGLAVAAIMFVPTGAYREYLATIADAHGMPPVGEVARYNLACLTTWITTRWRR